VFALLGLVSENEVWRVKRGDGIKTFEKHLDRSRCQR